MRHTAVPDVIRRAETTFALSLETTRVLRQGRATVIRAFSVNRRSRQLVIIKQFEELYREHFARECAGLRVLSTIAALEGFVPRLLASDAAGLVLLIEGIVERASYSDAVFSEDPAVAAPTLIATARRLGVLHGHARSSVSDFRADVPAPSHSGSLLRNGIGSTLAFLRRTLSDDPAAAGEFAPGSEIHSQLMEVAERVDECDDLITITVGDMAPSNVLLGPQGPVFIDLEYCGVRHGFYDAMYWHCICPFAADIVDQMDLAYRDGLGAAGVRISDEQYRATMLLFMSHRLFWTLSWNMESLFQRDREVIPGVSTRRTIGAYLREYLRFATAVPRIEQSSLVSLVGRLEQRLSRLWPELAR